MQNQTFEYLKKYKVVLFGAGCNGIKKYDELVDIGITPSYFIDNIPDKRIISATGNVIPVYKPDFLQAEDKKKLKIIVTPYQPVQRCSILTQIEKMGFNNCIYKPHKPNLPTAVRIEASTLCQLNCPACHMRLNNYNGLGKGNLKFKDFKNFIDKHPYIISIELANNGEMFLNPDLINMIKYAYQKKIRLTCDNGTNFNTVSDEALETLVKYCFRSIKLSIDGASQEVYSIYRRNGNYNRVINNIEKLMSYKKKYNSEYPIISWQYILMQHNECDIIRAKSEAKRLNINIYFKKPWTSISYKPQNIDFVKNETGIDFSTNQEETEIKISPYASRCGRLWTSPQINWDGTLYCCGVEYNKEKGYLPTFSLNVFDNGLEECMKASNYIYAQNMVQGIVPMPKINPSIPCIDCQTYKNMLKTSSFLSFEES